MVMKRFWIVRILQLITLCVIAVVIANQMLTLQSESRSIRNQQTEKFSYALTNLAASEASRYLSQDKTEELELLISDLRNDPMVLDTTIYDQLGKTIAQSKDNLPLPDLLNITEAETETTPGEVSPIPVVKALTADNNKIGYIRLTLDQDNLLSMINDYQMRSFNTLLLVFSLIFASGLITMAICYKRLTIICNGTIRIFQKSAKYFKKSATK